LNTRTLITRRHGLAALFGLACAALRPARAADAPLRLALAPFLSPAALLTAYRPLREHIERVLRRPVEMATAKDFRTLVEAARRGEHDVVQLPAHLARLAMVDWGFDFVAVPTERVSVVVVVKDGGPVRAAGDLKGRSVGMLDPLSLTATVGRRWLQDQGLTADVEVQALPSVNSGLFALDRGDVAAFVAADTQLLMLPPSTPRSESVLATVTDIPGPIFISRPGLPAADLAALRSAMHSFTPDPARPATTANSAFRGIDQPRLVRLDPLAAIARQALATPR
jgi:ABC-type phosphate/phosphonate transport system substrate-binding protein